MFAPHLPSRTSSPGIKCRQVASGKSCSSKRNNDAGMVFSEELKFSDEDSNTDSDSDAGIYNAPNGGGMCVCTVGLSYTIVAHSNRCYQVFSSTIKCLRSILPFKGFRDTSNSPSFSSSTASEIRINKILSDINLCVVPGELLAIMGPSGCGKTTLLNALAGRIQAKNNCKDCRCTISHIKGTKSCSDAPNQCSDETNDTSNSDCSSSNRRNATSVEGSIYVNGKACNSKELRQHTALVMAKDSLIDSLTVRETLLMAAMFKMKRLDKSSIDNTVDTLLLELGLYHIRNSCIAINSTNSNTSKTISCGEMKRVAIGVELINNPSILLLDEPTTGLDSSLSFDIFLLLLRLTRTFNRIVICSIHQPRSQMFDQFDKLLLMSKGRIVYQGSADSVLRYFADIGHVCPPQFNPADFILDILSVYNIKNEDEKKGGEWRIKEMSNISDDNETKEATPTSTLITPARDICGNAVDSSTTGSSENWRIGKPHSRVGRIHLCAEEVSKFPSIYARSALAQQIHTTINKHISSYNRLRCREKAGIESVRNQAIGLSWNDRSRQEGVAEESEEHGKEFERKQEKRNRVKGYQNRKYTQSAEVLLSEPALLSSQKRVDAGLSGSRNCECTAISIPASPNGSAPSTDNTAATVLASSPNASLPQLVASSKTHSSGGTFVSFRDFFTDVRLIAWRSWTYWWRNPRSGFLGSMFLHILLALLLGGIWYQLRGAEGRETNAITLWMGGKIENEVSSMASDFRNIVGGLFFIVTFLSFSSFSSISTFSNERVIFNRETASNMYGPLSYFFGKTLADMPYQHLPATIFLCIFYLMSGLDREASKVFWFLFVTNLVVFASNSYTYFLVSIFKSLSLVYLVVPLSLILMMLLASFFISVYDLPSWISWCQYLSFINYAFVALCVNQLPPHQQFGILKNAQLLSAMGMPEYRQDVYRNCALLALWGLTCRILAFFALKLCNRKQGLQA